MLSYARKLFLLYWQLRNRGALIFNQIAFPPGARMRGPVQLRRSKGGQMSFGQDMLLVGSTTFNRAGINHPVQIVVGSNGVLTIGDCFHMSGGSVFCVERISIGNHVMFGANSKVFDTDFHPVDWQARRAKMAGESAPVEIGDDVWLGADVTVLKGVKIGARTVVAAGSVVVSDLPADCVAAGVPAKPVRKL
ncbi:acyltransferase [Rhodopirellula sp. MGV]|uniref:acyltransferase n=1 Tax=Rhodopirellula sp. MGV TaxID=2023130 RepID=UPI000B978F08|nr:acyltransferase [Rhodopirellula sp. MGV]OYP37320.1 hypothetical protein CGZ80_05450 [Rhodopirellula sp. MGV]PNY36410.1 acyltransferase [Rhodopirellula baltica]